jgi:hypothetical protein
MSFGAQTKIAGAMLMFMGRISQLLRTQLEESGWEDDLKDIAKGEIPPRLHGV